MRIWAACMVTLLAGGVSAAPVLRVPVKTSPVSFVPNYVGSLAISLNQRPFYAGELLGNFDTHLAKVTPMTRPEEVAEYLRAQTVGNEKPAKVVQALGRESLDSNKASAILLANALARPDQFKEVLTQMERLKPAWGQRIAAAMANAENAGGSRTLLQTLRDTGQSLRPDPFPGRYNARAKLEGLFDGSGK